MADVVLRALEELHAWGPADGDESALLLHALNVLLDASPGPVEPRSLPKLTHLITSAAARHLGADPFGANGPVVADMLPVAPPARPARPGAPSPPGS